MKICYLLESTELSGGVRVVFDHARALGARGHQVIIRAKCGIHDWYPFQISVNYINNLACPFHLDDVPDVVVATFWTTVQPALQLGCKHTFHFCQGYEGDFVEYAQGYADIFQAYQTPIPKITIGSWLQQRLQQIYGKEAFEIHCVGQIVDMETFRPSVLPLRSFLRRLFGLPVRVLIVGSFGPVVKAIGDALYAVALMRACGQRIHLTRVASQPCSPEEDAITSIQSYRKSLSARCLAGVYRNTDLLLASSLQQEGFGLPFAEALASGIPCVATEISSYLSFDTSPDYAVFVPQGSPRQMAEAAINLLRNPLYQMKLRRRGPQVVAKRCRAAMVAQRLERVFVGGGAR
ncbi:MAG: glycosyltransferase family 4 protein [Deltaproteobacteria bacterium]|nr:glycosyltransferase family 4 protein [Deltaproteobacteria bacterium]